MDAVGAGRRHAHQHVVLPRRPGRRRGGDGRRDRRRQRRPVADGRPASRCSPARARPSSRRSRCRRTSGPIVDAGAVGDARRSPARWSRSTAAAGSSSSGRRSRPGTSVAPCTTQPSSEWYLAEGFTAENSNEQLVLTNPYSESAIVDIGFATADGSREPSELQGFPVPPRSVRVIDMDSIAARDEAEVAVKVVATRGNLIVGRAQVYDGGGRLGYSMSLASPALRSQWWFANGAKGRRRHRAVQHLQPDRGRRRGDAGVPRHPGGHRRARRTDRRAGPAGRHVRVGRGAGPARRSPRRRVRHRRTSRSRSSSSGRSPGRSRASRRRRCCPAASPGPRTATSPTRGRWRSGPARPTEDALVVYNTTSADATVTVQAVTADGVVTVPSLAELALPARGDRHDPAHRPGGASTASSSSARRRRCSSSARCPREPAAQGRSASWAVPVVS